MAIIFIMKKLAKSHPLLSSMLSTTDKVIEITNKTFDNNGQEVTTDGHPALDPIWIQAAHLQLAASDWSKMTFDPAFGLETGWVQSSVLIQRYGVNADESRWDPGRDDALRLEDVEHGGVR